MTAFVLAMALIAQAGAISGVIRTEKGEPVRGLRVAALSVVEEETPGAPSKISLAWIASTETDSAGRYRLPRLPAGQYVISAGLLSDPTYYPGTIALAEAVPITITNREVEAPDFALAEWSRCMLQRGGPAQQPALGGVTTGSARISIAGGVVVRATRSGDSVSETARVGLDGMFQMNLKDGQYDISVQLLPAGYSLGSIRSGAKDLTREKYVVGPCGPGGTADAGIEVTLKSDDPRFSVTGRVTEAAGKALNNVLVQVDSTSGTEDRSFLKDGVFEFPGLAAGPYTIRVFGADLQEILSQQIEVKDNDVTLALTITMP